MTFSATELEALHTLVGWRIEHHGDPTKRWAALHAKIGGEMAIERPGRLVFRLELPTEPVPIRRGRKTVNLHIAPTMNEYSSQKGWMRDIARKELDARILAAKTRFVGWNCKPKKSRKWVAERYTAKSKKIPGRFLETVLDGPRRFVRVTRYSSRRLDEPSTDAIGGKMPIDRLRIADIIAGDSAKWLVRQAVWMQADPGAGRVVVEVFTLGDGPEIPVGSGRKRA